MLDLCSGECTATLGVVGSSVVGQEKSYSEVVICTQNWVQSESVKGIGPVHEKQDRVIAVQISKIRNRRPGAVTRHP